jgi:hypothetical protein
MKLPNKPKVLAATENKGHKMFTVMVDFPTVLLAELRTHRILTQGSLYEHSELTDLNLSANSARAIPTNKYLQKVLDNPFVPIWTKQQSGMSGKLLAGDTSFENEYLGDTTINDMWKNFLEEGNGFSLQHVYHELLKQGVHKQNSNRLLAPYAWTTCVLSGTEWDNFFELRCPKYTLTNHSPQKTIKVYNSRYEAETAFGSELYQCARELGFEDISEEFWQTINKSPAQPEFQVIAEMIYDLYWLAPWRTCNYHIPFEKEIEELFFEDAKSHWKEKHKITKSFETFYYYGKDNCITYSEWMEQYAMLISASMCAKLSYDTQDKEDTLQKHLDRAQVLIDGKHWEPFSHQAKAMTKDEMECFAKTLLVKTPREGQQVIDSPNGVLHRVMEHGWCYNLKGFISQRYMLENF